MSVYVKKDNEWTKVAGTNDGGTGDVSKKYVDDQDNSMLTDAKSYADSQDQNLKNELSQNDTRIENDLKAKDQLLESKIVEVQSSVHSQVSASESSITAAYKAADATLKSDITSAYNSADSAQTTAITNAYKAADSSLETSLKTYIRNQNKLNDWETQANQYKTDANPYYVEVTAACDGIIRIEYTYTVPSYNSSGCTEAVTKFDFTLGSRKVLKTITNVPLGSGDTVVSEEWQVVKGEKLIGYAINYIKPTNNTNFTSNGPMLAERARITVRYYKDRDYTGR